MPLTFQELFNALTLYMQDSVFSTGAAVSALLFGMIPRATYQNRCSSQNLLLSASKEKLGQECAAGEV